MKYLYLLLILVFTITAVSAQDENVLNKDIIVLDDRTQISGQILELKKKTVIIRIGGNPVIIKRRTIKHIFFKGEEAPFSMQAPENVEVDTLLVTNGTFFEMVPIKKTEKRGFYNISYGSIGIGGDGGLGLENVTGFQLNQYTGLGLGFGYQDMNLGGYYYRAGKIIPVYAEYRGYFNKGKVSVYYNVAVGASLGFKNEESFYDSTTPGTYFNPSIGYKCGSENASFMIDLGLRFASITHKYEDTNNYYYFPTGSVEEKSFYRQVVLRLGIML